MLSLPIAEEFDILLGPPIEDWKVGSIVNFTLGQRRKRSEACPLSNVKIVTIGGPPGTHKRYRHLQTFTAILLEAEGKKLLLEGYYNPKSRSYYTKGRATIYVVG